MDGPLAFTTTNSQVRPLGRVEEPGIEVSLVVTTISDRKGAYSERPFLIGSNAISTICSRLGGSLRLEKVPMSS